MSPRQRPEHGASLLQLNSELQHAQLELLSAHCATHQLRLHYSAEDLVRFGRRDILRKSAQAASALHEYYSAIERRIPNDAPEAPAVPRVNSEQIVQAVKWLASYLRAQRDHYLPAAAPLSDQQKADLSSYYADGLLDRIRVLELKGARVTAPDFFTHARTLGFDNLPEISHMDSLTFLDVVVFNEYVSDRALFHALVHTAQIEVLGLERYAELWVCGYLKTRAHFTVPLEVHAFSLASKFLRPKPEKFSVEDQVMLWLQQDRY